LRRTSSDLSFLVLDNEAYSIFILIEFSVVPRVVPVVIPRQTLCRSYVHGALLARRHSAAMQLNVSKPLQSSSDSPGFHPGTAQSIQPLPLVRPQETMAGLASSKATFPAASIGDLS
jgi:hypothetical protein